MDYGQKDAGAAEDFVNDCGVAAHFGTATFRCVEESFLPGG
jgi:hypothetical protein